MKKNKVIQSIKEEIKLFAEQNQLSSEEMFGIVDRLMKKLDSLDMSLDLIYGTLAGYGAAETGARIKALGRFGMHPVSRRRRGKSNEN